MQGLFSPLLIGVGQTAAILVYLLYDEPDAFSRRPSRVALVCGFYLLQSGSQAFLHRYVSAGGWGSLPSLQFLLITWCLYALFLLLWSRAQWPSCCFVAFVLLLVDACIWPLMSSISRLLWGVNYLYEGALPLRVPFILLLSALECLLARLVRRQLPELRKIHLSLYDAVLALAIVLPFLYLRMLAGQSTSQDDKSVQVVMTLCCLVAVIALASEVGRASSEYEKMRDAQMRSVLRSQQQMFEQKLADADLINQKYHDMKNFLLYLQADQSGQDLGPSIDQLLQSIEPYGNAVATGNGVIDVVLNEKLAVCARLQITCIPYLDGSLFSFVQPLDLCTLIGNAMDNAIESCQQIPEPERRFIHLSTTAKGGSVLLSVRNTFQTRPDLRGGLPATTKADTRSHGYGLRNMRAIAERYGGSLSCRIEQEEFVLSILLDQEANPPA